MSKLGSSINIKEEVVSPEDCRLVVDLFVLQGNKHQKEAVKKLFSLGLAYEDVYLVLQLLFEKDYKWLN